MKSATGAVLAVVVLAGVCTAQGATLLTSIPTTPTGNWGQFNSVVFKPKVDIWITHVGVFNPLGLAASTANTQIALIDSTGLASGVMIPLDRYVIDAMVIPSGTVSVDGNFWLELAAPVKLTAGVEYAGIHNTNAGNNSFVYSQSATTLSVDPNIEWVGGGSNNEHVNWVFPGRSASSARVGTNFQYSAIPEPATMSLLALAGVAALIRRKR